MNHLWKGTFYGDLRSVDVHVRHLRQKVEVDDVGAPAHPDGPRRGLRVRRGGREGVTPPRVFGLQGWLVGALLAVGMAASLAVLLVVLPTLESSVRGDRAKREAEELARDRRAGWARTRASPGPPHAAELRRVWPPASAPQTGAEVRRHATAGSVLSTGSQAVVAPQNLAVLAEAHAALGQGQILGSTATPSSRRRPLFIDGADAGDRSRPRCR